MQKSDEKGRKSGRTGWQNLDQVFNAGQGFSIWWFFPTDVPKTLVVEKEFE